MKLNVKKSLILVLILVTVFSLSACDLFTDSDSDSDITSPEDIEVIVEGNSSEDMGVLNKIRKSELEFALEDIQQGSLIFATESDKIYPKEVEFSEGRAEIKEMYTNAADEKLQVAVEDFSGNQIHEFSLTLDSVSPAEEVQALAETQDSSQVRGFFVGPAFSDAFEEWIYFSDFMIYDEFDFYRQFNLLIHLQNHAHHSYYVDEPNNRYGTWDEYKVEGLDGLTEVEDFVSFYKEAEPRHHYEPGILIYRDAEAGQFRSSIGNEIYVSEAENIEGEDDDFHIPAGKDLSGSIELKQIGQDDLDLEAVREMAKIKYGIDDDEAQEIKEFKEEAGVHVHKRVDEHEYERFDTPLYLEGEEIEEGTFDFEINNVEPNEYNVIFGYDIVLFADAEKDKHWDNINFHSGLEFEAYPVAEVLDEEEPWQPSINDAIDVADQGEIRIYEGYHGEPHMEDVEITGESDLRIFGEHKPQIEGSMTIEDSEHITIENLYIENSGHQNTVEIQDSEHIALGDNVIRGHGERGIYTSGETDEIFFAHNVIEYSGEGIHLDEGSNISIIDNEIEDNGHGIHIVESDVEIKENTIKDNWIGIFSEKVGDAEDTDREIRDNEIKENEGNIVLHDEEQLEKYTIEENHLIDPHEVQVLDYTEADEERPDLLDNIWKNNEFTPDTSSKEEDIIQLEIEGEHHWGIITEPGPKEPEFSHAVVEDGTSIELWVYFDEVTVADDGSGFSVKATEGDDIEIDREYGDYGLIDPVEDSEELKFQLDRNVESSDELEVSYDESEGNAVSAEDGSPAQGFEGEPVTNEVN